MNIAYFTICSRNYLAYALTLRESLREAAPNADFRIFLADAPIDGASPCDSVVDLDALALPDRDDMAFRYTVLEFNTAIKPFCFQYLFDRAGADAAIYLDPDILALKPFTHVIDALEGGADAVLTPHITAPLDDDGAPGDLDILRSGTFNLGFIALSNTPEARRFIDWWAKRCETQCLVDLASGLFVDQKFAEFIPSFIEQARIVRNPGYNVAYWNLAHRPVARDGEGGWTAGGEPLRFFHFSGVAPDDRSVFSKHQDRFRPETIGEARDLLTDYLGRLAANGADRWRAVPYGFDRFSDGRLIPAAARRIYAKRKAAGETMTPFEPFDDALNAPSPDVDQSPAPVTLFMREVWRSRPDLQQLFPLASAAGRRGFARWFVLYAEKECRADATLTAPARAGGRGAALKLAQRVFRALPEPARKFVARRGSP